MQTIRTLTAATLAITLMVTSVEAQPQDMPSEELKKEFCEENPVLCVFGAPALALLIAWAMSNGKGERANDCSTGSYGRLPDGTVGSTNIECW